MAQSNWYTPTRYILNGTSLKDVDLRVFKDRLNFVIASSVSNPRTKVYKDRVIVYHLDEIEMAKVCDALRNPENFSTV